LAFPQYNIVTNYGSEDWNTVNNGYDSDDGKDLYKTTMFTRAVETAKARNPANGYKLELRATELIKDTAGKVIGVKAVYRDGATYQVYGKTVILAAGGFIGSRDMKLEYYGADVREEAVHTDRGDGIAMGLAAGAGTYNIDMPGTVHIAQVKNIVQEKLFDDPAKDTLYKTVVTNLLLKGDSLVVALNQGQTGDLRGKRFTNESGMFQPGIAFDSWKAGGFFAAIYSKNVLDDIKANGYKFTAMTMFLGQGNPPAAGTAITDLDDILAKGAAQGNVVTAATLDELETVLGVPAGTLKATIDQYNTYVDGAPDANPEYEKGAGFGAYGPTPSYYTSPKVDSATGPYTAILGAGYFYGSGGGLDIDDDMQVLNTSKAKIPGLYAVGQDSMGVLFNAKKAYVGYGAAAQGWAITSGRLAGQKAAAEAKQ
jgi:hypothetical protein